MRRVSGHRYPGYERAHPARAFAVVVAWAGIAAAAFAGAVSSLTEPSSGGAGIVVLASGVALGAAGATGASGLRRARRRRALRRASGPTPADQVVAVGRVAQDIAEGNSVGFVVLDVARMLVELLSLDDCRFELPPFAATDRPSVVLDGELELRHVRWSPARDGIPTEGFEIPVIARGRVEGRFVCTSVDHRTLTPERLTTAKTLADQVASALLLDALV